MEKEFFLNEGDGTSTPQTAWNYSQLQSSIYNQNCENSMDQCDPFESALSSIVSSPVASSAINGSGGENFMLRELIGRLGSICNSGEISPHSYVGGSTNTSCYNTPLNSPPKLNLSMPDPRARAGFQFSGHHLPSHPNISPFSADPGFSERAARFSCFNNNGSFNGRMGLKETEKTARSISRVDSGKLSRVCGNQSKSGGPEGKDGNSIPEKKFNWFSRSSTPENTEFGGSREGSTLSEQNPAGESRVKVKGDYNSRKRKSIPKGEAKESKAAEEKDESKTKKNKQNEVSGNEKDASKAKAEPTADMKDEQDGDQKQTKEDSKPPEPPKDYIHVRARRGQATDSHSLAERVRREKISKRMKFLQDLVPGCDKVTGKAVMLDEIINYVQSLQRQVEFLSMKLSTINPRLDITMEGLLPKDIFQSRGSFPHTVHNSDPSVPPFSSSYQPLQFPAINGGASSGTELNLPMNSLNDVFRRNNLHAGYGESSHQVSEFWEDDLHSVVQMGYDQNQQQSFHGSMAETQMKTEL